MNIEEMINQIKDQVVHPVNGKYIIQMSAHAHDWLYRNTVIKEAPKITVKCNRKKKRIAQQVAMRMLYPNDIRSSFGVMDE